MKIKSYIFNYCRYFESLELLTEFQSRNIESKIINCHCSHLPEDEMLKSNDNFISLPNLGYSGQWNAMLNDLNDEDDIILITNSDVMIPKIDLLLERMKKFYSFENSGMYAPNVRWMSWNFCKKMLEKIDDFHIVPSTDSVIWSLRKEIAFEIGTEEQSGSAHSQEEINYTLGKINAFCDKNKFPKPIFVVVQTGTRVMEMRNVGSLDNPFRVVNEMPAEIQVPKMVEICNKHGVLLKEHNADYLSDEILRWHPRLGIHAANVAPEFGVAETKAFINILERNSLANLVEDFLSLSFSSNKWKKWILDKSETTDRDKAIISGHYVFSNPTFLEIKSRAERELSKRNIRLNSFLRTVVRNSIYRYVRNFRLV